MISATNLVVRQRFGPGPTIALNAHGDVVPPGEGWTHPIPTAPKSRDGVMYGRGVAVSKSDFATYAFALLAPAAERLAAGRHGRAALHLRRGGRRPDRSRLAPRAGHQQARFRDLARASPTASSPPTTAACISKSRSRGARRTPRCPTPASMRWKPRPACWPRSTACAESWRKRVVQDRGHRLARSSTVGLITGGINTNVVPDASSSALDRRIVPEEDPAAVERDLRQLIEAAAAAPCGHPLSSPAHPARAAA